MNEQDFETHMLEPAERNYTFSQSRQISMQTGLIGYLRADMDSNGLGFYSSWYDFRKDLKTDEFKAEFDDVINSQRAEGGFLSCRQAMEKYCYEHPESSYGDERNHYGVRIDSGNYAYLMRLNPNRGEYNLYCYCYQKEWLDRHLEKTKNGIRFIDSSYKEKFRIPDGGKIKITLNDGSSMERTCRYIDDYHLEVGNSLYHICEFAERMEQNGNQVEPAENTGKPKERPKNKDKER